MLPLGSSKVLEVDCLGSPSPWRLEGESEAKQPVEWLPAMLNNYLAPAPEVKEYTTS